MNTIKEAITILRAMEDGIKIQAKCCNGSWIDFGNIMLPNFGSYSYRIKPAPVKRLIRVEELPDECWVTYNGGLNADCVIGFSVQSESIRLIADWHELNSFPANAKWSPSRRGPWYSFEMTEEEIQQATKL